MNSYDTYIPREYLTLRINACKAELAALPDVRLVYRTIRGKKHFLCRTREHLYKVNSEKGEPLYNIACRREYLEGRLAEYIGLWHSAYIGMPPVNIVPRKIARTINEGYGNSRILNGEYFASLKNDADPNYPDSKRWFYDGVLYRSAAEKAIAEFYTSHGIPFKYEPEVWIDGLSKPVYPDFVILIEELDCCKIHEHMGMLGSSDYLRTIKLKFSNYTNAGLIPEYDFFFTYDSKDLPFNVRSLMPRLNTIVNNTLYLP